MELIHLNMSSQSIWKISKYLVARFLLLLILGTATFYYREGRIVPEFLGYLIVIFVIFHSVAIYLCIEYFVLNWKKSYRLGYEGLYIDNGPLIPIDTIDHIELVMSKSRSTNDWVDYAGLRHYYFAQFHLKNKQIIGPLTCLISVNLMEDLKVFNKIPILSRDPFIPSAWPKEGA